MRFCQPATFATLCLLLPVADAAAEPYLIDGMLESTDAAENSEGGEYFWVCDYHGNFPPGAWNPATDGPCGNDRTGLPGTRVVNFTGPFWEPINVTFDAGPPPHTFTIGSGSLFPDGDPNEPNEGCCSGDDSGEFTIYLAAPPPPNTKWPTENEWRNST
jgi:hypothetical protein